MSDSLINICIGAITGAIITGIFAWINIKKTIKFQYKLTRINKIRDCFLDIIAKIDTFNDERKDHLIIVLKDYCFECGIAIKKVNSSLSNSQNVKINQKYEDYEKQCDLSMFDKNSSLEEIKNVHKEKIKSILEIIK